MSYFTGELSIYDINKWIRDLFQDADMEIPDIESNYDCLKLISRIISINKEAEKDAEETIRTQSNLIDYYFQKGEEISSSISRTCSLNDLQPDVVAKVKRIASVATQMKLNEPTITNFMLGAATLENKMKYSIEQEFENIFFLYKFNKRISDTTQKTDVLERDIEMLKKKVSKQQVLNSDILEKTKFFKNKVEEYKKRNKKIEKQLKNQGWKPSLSHDELVKRSEVVESLELKVTNLTVKLESYQNLPPNEMLTQFKIEEAQAELLRLQNEFDNMLKVLC